MSSRDRDFRPARRRGFDDDNYEAPWRDFRSAPQFSAQRFDPPSGPPIQAVVKWYNPDKGFGFVQLADGSGDAFLHVSVVERSGHGGVPPGATLEVRAGPGAKGPQVTEILSVDTSTAPQGAARTRTAGATDLFVGQSGRRRRDRRGQMVQRREGIWLHRIGPGRQGYLRPHFGAQPCGHR